MSRLLLLSVLSLVAFACSGQKNAKDPNDETEKTPSDLNRMLPLKDRTVSNFQTESSLGNGVLVLEYFRPRDDHAEIRLAGAVQHVRISRSQISYATGGSLLKLPLLKGKSFPGSFGMVVIEEIDQTVQVPAGTYKGCLTTREQSKMPPKRSVSVYCPDVGLVKLLVETFGEEESASLLSELKYHGPRVDLNR
jgi:hypothetical protein